VEIPNIPSKSPASKYLTRILISAEGTRADRAYVYLSMLIVSFFRFNRLVIRSFYVFGKLPPKGRRCALSSGSTQTRADTRSFSLMVEADAVSVSHSSDEIWYGPRRTTKPSNEYEKVERTRTRTKLRLKMNIGEDIRVDKDSF